MTETQRRDINNVLKEAGFTPLTSYEESFIDSFILNNIALSGVCLNLYCGFQIANNRFKNNICGSLNKEKWELLYSLNTSCVLPEEIIKQDRGTFTFGIPL